MKANKMIATLVVLTMLLSTLVVFKQLDVIKEASAATPGVDTWGNATTNLVYGVAYSSVTIDTTKWTGVSTVYLYYPTYKNTGAGPYADTFTWNGPYKVGGISANIVAADINKKSAPLNPTGVSISFNRSGMWVFATEAQYLAGIDGNDNSSYTGYFWVNSSTVYTIQSVSDFNYGAAGSLTVTVDTGDDTGCMISIMDPDNNTIYHKWRATGVSDSIKIEAANFSVAGDYTVKAYRDFDLQNEMYLYADEDGQNYSMYYGSGISGVFPAATDYYYSDMGPWDPPEKNATNKKFTVNTGKPNIVLTNTTLYWGYKARIEVNITDNDGKGIAVNKEYIKLRFGSTYTDVAFINSTGLGNYTIEIPRWFLGTTRGWVNLSGAVGANVNGTWRVVFGWDDNGDGVYEWNNSASFVVKSATPPVQLNIVNDGSGSASDKKVDVPAYVSGANKAATINISFEILGRSIIDQYGNAYYGDDNTPNQPIIENYKNITIEGDILYPVDAHYVGPNGEWYARVTPTKPGGTITISIDWPGSYNGTATQTIEIVNGTHVTVAVESFTVGSDYNLTVKVIDMDGDTVKNAYVTLMWEDVPLKFNNTNGTNQPGKGQNGEYTFWIRSKDATTPATAPQNITIAARWYTGFWGYTKVVMNKNHNMRVNITPTTSYAGDSTEYDITVSLLEGGNPATTGLTVELRNETGALVKGGDAWSVAAKNSIVDEEIILSGGTYYLYAYNATHDSRGNNATILITKYAVTFSPSVLAWKVDKAVNMTFQVMPAGDGSLTINNMSSLPNASSVGQSYQITIENGVGSLDKVNATTLGNVTFDYAPDGGQARGAEGLLRITTATATPSPHTVYLGEPTQVTVTITHPATGAPLSGVEVGLDLDKNTSTTLLSKLPTNLFTNAQGKVTFAITAEGSGNIIIFIENETDPDNEFVIHATARKPMSIHLNPSVNEGNTFTVEAKSNGVLITDATVTFTFDGQTWPTNTGVATITSPTVSTSMAYPITASAEGYITATGAIITVLNIPKLIVAVAGEVKAGQTFTLTVADDTGSAVIGATVTFEQKTYTTGAGGSVTMTAPSKAGSYAVTATFPGYDSVSSTVTIAEGGGIPGFELLTLIAAIGVAFLLLRRRRK